MTKLQAKNIVKHFDHNGNSVLALDGINLDVQEGDFVCIVGPSGCGKSTFLNIIAGLERPDDGEILLNGKPISTPGPDRTMVFQEGALFPWLTVIDNVEFGLKMAGIPKDERRQISQRYLDMMQLTKFADSYIYQLSTGMKQRVAIARALAMDPEILLMDEPFAALDSQTRDLLLVELQLIWERTRKTIVFVTHNISESVILGNRVVIFKNRPSKIKKEIVIDYRRPRLMEDENLQKYYHQIVEELKSEVIARIKDENQ
ncbi:MAG TPA: ABC transporter ATP-binding protein [Candidatus Nitrosotalea sp.]|nr:ABC transporter ATP-binding protein [Candidatus Nitrosotalea sp.]